MPTRVLILPRHDVQAAGCRYRYTQFIPYLAGCGFECTVAPFFDAEYTRALLGDGRKAWWRLGMCLARRIQALVGARRYDLVVVRTELVPYLLPALEDVLIRLGVPYVFDFDDAFFHQYDQHRLRLVRWVFQSKIPNLIRKASLNIAGSRYLADYASRFSARVAIVPTVIDLTRYPPSPVRNDPDVFRIGWIGSPSTTDHLRAIIPELREFCRGRRAEVVAIGAKPFDPDGTPIRWVRWSEASEVVELSRTDVGIMPLPETPWAAGKCGLKLIQAMGCWRPVVASPIGANCQIVEHGITGLHAEAGGWTRALQRLYEDDDLRQRLGSAARRRVEQEYSLQVWAPRVAKLWTQAASGDSPGHSQFSPQGAIT